VNRNRKHYIFCVLQGNDLHKFKQSIEKQVAIYCSKQFTTMQVILLQCLLSLFLSKGKLKVKKTSKLELEKIYSSIPE